MRKSTMKFRDDVTTITAWRKPTSDEIKYGEGATHYKDFPVKLWKDENGLPKTWIKCQDDGLRYYR